mmetsp:Transcript_57869/g.183545  ORF Transcript_57869/g.183545 Transcript_57869/m.183545 type:complete len:213 (-) Transcript_57869:128-766(-)
MARLHGPRSIPAARRGSDQRAGTRVGARGRGAVRATGPRGRRALQVRRREGRGGGGGHRSPLPWGRVRLRLIPFGYREPRRGFRAAHSGGLRGPSFPRAPPDPPRDVQGGGVSNPGVQGVRVRRRRPPHRGRGVRAHRRRRLLLWGRARGRRRDVDRYPVPSRLHPARVGGQGLRLVGQIGGILFPTLCPRRGRGGRGGRGERGHDIHPCFT